METSTPAYHWLRTLQPELKKLDEIPLTGNTPPFPWKQLSHLIARSFEKDQLTIEPKELTWRTKEQLFDGLGDDVFALNFTVPSFDGQVSWVMPEQEMTTIETLLLTKESHPISFQDRSLSESFYRFLALEVLYNLTQISYDQSITPILIKETTRPNFDALCLDISLSIQNQSVSGRLIISPEFRRAWVEHFANIQHSSALTQEMTQLVEVMIQIEVGHTFLNLQEWMNVQLGDLIILDRCSLDPNTFEGRVMLTVHGKPIFRGKIKETTLKLLELPLLNEVETPMAKYSPDQDLDDDDFSDLDLTDSDEHTQEDTHSSSIDLNELDDNLFDDDTLDSATDSSQTQSSENKGKLSNKSIDTAQPITPEKIPVTLTIEAGRIQMTMEQLLKLEVGNLLDLNLHPESGVDLAINGAIVGKGELLRIGELLGVRVLKLGK